MALGTRGRPSQILRAHPDILAQIGGTPLVRLGRLPDPKGARVYAKLEQFNPGGSVKDRIALSMILDAERRGLLKPGGTILEPTSGNTGIGLAMVGAVRGYRVIIVLSESMSHERHSLLTSYGAEVVFSSGEGGMMGSVVKAEEIQAEHADYFMPQQFNNPANPEIHRRTTARELLRDMGAQVVDAFVAGVGTGGTITGVGEVLKARRPATRVVAVEPAGCAVLSGGQPGPHQIQGIGAGFVPRVLNRSVIDQIEVVTDQEAYDHSKALAREEGIAVGISAGAAVSAALRVARGMSPEENVVVVLPDGAERYFSLEPYFR
ncbi:MAG: cysteine synthase A [Candidatus Tectomicrobia bacterium]|nr:cysteine synthase A [Candidatus Tectomicrobia bacterium]